MVFTVSLRYIELLAKSFGKVEEDLIDVLIEKYQLMV